MRAALITAVIIPLSMLVGFIGMKLFGVSANLMSRLARLTSACSSTARWDDRELRAARSRTDHGLPDESAHHRAIRRATSAENRSRTPDLFGVHHHRGASDLLPSGTRGKMFRPMAITVCSALLGSLLLSLTAVPVFASYFPEATS